MASYYNSSALRHVFLTILKLTSCIFQVILGISQHLISCQQGGRGEMSPQEAFESSFR
jgi:hypothetical protein